MGDEKSYAPYLIDLHNKQKRQALVLLPAATSACVFLQAQSPRELLGARGPALGGGSARGRHGGGQFADPHGRAH